MVSRNFRCHEVSRTHRSVHTIAETGTRAEGYKAPKPAWPRAYAPPPLFSQVPNFLSYDGFTATTHPRTWSSPLPRVTQACSVHASLQLGTQIKLPLWL